jgi:glutathione S-transferase
MKIEGSIPLAAGAQLYYIPTACSLAAHVVAREADLAIELVRVDVVTKKTETGDDYRKINPRGYVPALVIDGEVHGSPSERRLARSLQRDGRPASAGRLRRR